MMGRAALSSPRAFSWLLFRFVAHVPLLLLLSVQLTVAANENKETAYVYGTDTHGVTRQLAVDRTPALYTGDFGDCLGGKSLFNITKFDAAYYADNMTVLFHLDGTTDIHNESVMVAITMEAYGETRYTQTFDPCLVGMSDLCPLNASVPIMGYGSFALGPLETAAIPDIALQIPDFDGFVSLQIFANSTQTEIGCFQAVMTNGNTLAIPAIIAPTIAVFVAIAIVASFATAAYGISVPLMRAHYAHSLSVVLVIETLQTIFFTGALSIHWPSVLVAWWSNFAWSAGLINAPVLVAQMGAFTGVAGNASQVGNAGPAYVNDEGGRIAGQIYGTTDPKKLLSRALLMGSNFSTYQAVQDASASVFRRKFYNSSDPYDYTWGGDPVLPGIPLPGTWQSFAGTLSDLNIPGASAFTLSLFWMAMAVFAFPAVLLVTKCLFEFLAKIRWVQPDCMAYFRTHYKEYAFQTALRMLLVAFPPLITLAIFQFTLHSSPGSTALATLVFVSLVLGLALASARAISEGIRSTYSHSTEAEMPQEEPATLHSLPARISRFATIQLKETKGKTSSGTPRRRMSQIRNHLGLTGGISRPGYTESYGPGVHQDDTFIKRFGWLSARYRTGCWWFFVVYLFLQLIRACILGGGADNESNINTSAGGHSSSGPPTAQVAILVVFDVLVLILYAYYRPFEGRRNLALAVWILGIGRVLVAVLCIGLLPQTSLSRIGATVIGFVIIIIQVLMLAAVLVLVVIGAVSTWLSLTRNEDGFQSEMFFSVRKQYLGTLLASAVGAPPPPTRRQQRQQERELRKKEREAEERAASMPPPEPTFSVLEVRRAPKIEDVHYDESESDGENFRKRDGYTARDLERALRREIDLRRGEASGSGSGNISGNGSTNGDHDNMSPIPTSKPNSSSGYTADDVVNDDDDAANNEKDTLGNLEDMAVQNAKRRRANSGSSASLVGAQVYDPARVIARLNRSRTNSINSLRSIPSTNGSLRRVSAMSARSTTPGPQADGLAGRRSASPFGGHSSNPYGRLTEGPTGALPYGPLRSSSVPLVSHSDHIPLSGRTTPTSDAPISGRMTPTRETLRRYASERQALPAFRPEPVSE